MKLPKRNGCRPRVALKKSDLDAAQSPAPHHPTRVIHLTRLIRLSRTYHLEESTATGCVRCRLVSALVHLLKHQKISSELVICILCRNGLKLLRNHKFVTVWSFQFRMRSVMIPQG